jgi:molecular chaperone Hsp33
MMLESIGNRNDDRVLPYTVEPLDIRGRAVRLGPMVDDILRRHAYPDPVSQLLGQAVALAVLLGSALKFEGRFQIQTRADGPVDMLVVDFEAPDRVRGYARFDASRLVDGMSPEDVLGRGQLGLTIDQGNEMSRYQGIVALDGQGLEEAAQQYFRQSEQIPTRVRLAVGKVLQADGGGDLQPVWRAGGVMAQFMPTSHERQRKADLHPGDAPEGATILAFGDDDAWVEARLLIETVEDHELIDPTVTSEELLYRLFHESGVVVFESEPVIAQCRCSRERILSMIKGFPPEERREMVADDGMISVTCEFCSNRYDVAPDEAGI